jgi:hypothetical protein
MFNKDAVWFEAPGSVSPQFRVKRRDEDKVEVTNLGQLITAPTISINREGYLVFVYTFDSIILCYMNREVCRVCRFSAPLLNIPFDSLEEYRSKAQQAGVAPTTAVHPTDLYCVPNLYDLYTKLVAYG